MNPTIYYSSSCSSTNLCTPWFIWPGCRVKISLLKLNIIQHNSGTIFQTLNTQLPNDQAPWAVNCAVIIQRRPKPLLLTWNDVVPSPAVVRRARYLTWALLLGLLGWAPSLMKSNDSRWSYDCVARAALIFQSIFWQFWPTLVGTERGGAHTHQPTN